MNVSIEVLPKQMQLFLKLVKPSKKTLTNLSIMVPHINGTSFDDLIHPTQSMLNKGYRMIPHLGVRNLKKNDKQSNINSLLANSKAVVLLGGDNSDPELYDSVFSYIKENWGKSSPLEHVYFSSFPEGHPHLNKQEDETNLLKKIEWANHLGIKSYLINQICFDHEVIVNYNNRMKELAPDTQIIPSFISPCQFTKLLKIASISGIQNSLSFMRKTNVFKLLNSYNCDNLVTEVIKNIDNLDYLHAYPFGDYEGALKKLALYQNSCSKPQ